MKKHQHIESKAKSQIRQDIQNVFSGSNPKHRFTLPGLSNRHVHFIPLAGHGGSFILGKGPPGNSHSPGAGRGHPPEKTTGSPVSESPNTIQIQQNNKNQNSNFYNHLKFSIMKKQILILALFVMAMFVGVTNSYGQPTELNPSPGVEYTYGVTIPTGSNTSPVYLWHITESTDLIGGTPTVVGDGYYTVNGGYASSDIKLTWTANATGKVFYLVVLYTQDGVANGQACTVQNMRSFEIKPLNTLELTVTLAKSDGTDNTSNPEICPTDISTANVTPSVGVTPASVSYVYGQTILYYNINAKGMAGKWQPKVRIPALGGNGQSYTDVSWAVNSASPTFTTMSGFSAGGATQDLGLAADVDVTVAGSDYLVKVTINNAGFETTGANQSIQLSADGFLPTAYSTSDIIGGGNFNPAAAFAKSATYTILQRPDVATSNVLVPFITKTP